MLNYIQLETLKTIDEHGTIEGAARALRVSSFAVSQRIRQLEKSLGVKLLERAPTRVSEVGRILCEHLNQALSLQNETLNEPQDDQRIEQDNRPSYKIALPEDIATGSFTEIIKQLKQDNDPSRFDITICHPEKSSSLMQSGDVAAAISIRKTPIHGFKSYSLKELTYLAVASPQFIAIHFPDGVTEKSILAAPCLIEGLNIKWAEQVTGKYCKLPFYKSTSESLSEYPLLESKAWSLLPLDEAKPYLDDGSLIEIKKDAQLRHQLYWHISSAMLEQMKTITDKIRLVLG